MNKKFNFTTFNPTPSATSVNGGANVFDSNYLDEMREELIGKIVLEGDTMDWAHIIPGVKNRISLNEITGVDDFVDASCGWDVKGNLTLTQRELIVYPKQLKNEICPKTLETTYLGSYMRTNKEVPFVGVIAEAYVSSAHAFAEKFIYQGDGVNDGLYQIIDAEANVVDASVAVDAAATWIDRVNEMLTVTPAEVLERRDGILCMGYADFMSLVMELNATAQFTVTFNEGAPMEFYYPGTTILVKAVAGMNGIAAPTKGKNMILTYKDNIAVGTDMMNDEEVLDIFYSRDADAVKVNIQFKIGSQVYFPDFVVKGYAI